MIVVGCAQPPPPSRRPLPPHPLAEPPPPPPAPTAPPPQVFTDSLGGGVASGPVVVAPPRAHNRRNTLQCGNRLQSDMVQSQYQTGIQREESVFGASHSMHRVVSHSVIFELHHVICQFPFGLFSVISDCIAVQQSVVQTPWLHPFFLCLSCVVCRASDNIVSVEALRPKPEIHFADFLIRHPIGEERFKYVTALHNYFNGNTDGSEAAPTKKQKT